MHQQEQVCLVVLHKVCKPCNALLHQPWRATWIGGREHVHLRALESIDKEPSAVTF